MTHVASGKPLHRNEGEPQSGNRWWSLAVLTATQLMITLDTTIITIALPSAQHAVGLADADRQWVFTAYTLAYGGLLLLGGRLGDLFGRRRALLVGVAGFTLASALGGAAGTAGVLIAARALQGVFAAIIAPSVLALLTVTFTDTRERGKAFGIFSGGVISGIAVGLIVGGALTEYLDWRWCMFINVPIAVAMVVGLLLAVPNPAGRLDVSLDLAGTILGCGGMTALVFGCAVSDPTSVRAVSSFATAIVLLIAFVVVQARVSHPLMPLRLFRNRDRLGALLAGASSTLGAYGIFLFMTVHVQSVLHYSPLVAGFAFLPYVAVTVMISTQLIGRLLPILAPRILVVPGLVCIAGGLMLFTQLRPDSSYIGGVLPILLLFGVGMGTVVAPSTSVATRVGNPRDAGVASALMTTSQQIGGSIGTTVLNTIAAAVTGTFLAVHGSAATDAAIAHGNAVAAAWGSGILLTASVIVAVLIAAKAPSRTP